MTNNHDPYAALRFKEFNFFLVIRFLLVLGWTMQFIIIEWEVYNLTKDPLSLGLIGLAEIMPPLRVCVSGQQGGPDLCPVLELLGREEVVHRIERAIEKFL